MNDDLKNKYLKKYFLLNDDFKGKYPILSNYYKILLDITITDTNINSYINHKQLSLEPFLSNEFNSKSLEVWKGELLPYPACILDELLVLADEKFSIIRQDQNLNVNTDDVMGKLVNYCENNFVYGMSCGVQGIGKSAFFNKYFHRRMKVDVDKDYAFRKWDRKNIAKDYDEELDCRLSNKSSIIIDGMFHTKSIRKNRFWAKRTEKDYGEEVFFFLFDGQLKTCIDRFKKREILRKHDMVLPNIVTYIMDLEMPVNDDLTPEKGIDLMLIINENGELTSAYPVEKFNELFLHQFS